jgi:hypothetical protein
MLKLSSRSMNSVGDTTTRCCSRIGQPLSLSLETEKRAWSMSTTSEDTQVLTSATSRYSNSRVSSNGLIKTKVGSRVTISHLSEDKFGSILTECVSMRSQIEVVSFSDLGPDLTALMLTLCHLLLCVGLHHLYVALDRCLLVVELLEHLLLFLLQLHKLHHLLLTLSGSL